jgi:hypothetical protein
MEAKPENEKLCPMSFTTVNNKGQAEYCTDKCAWHSGKDCVVWSIASILENLTWRSMQ